MPFVHLPQRVAITPDPPGFATGPNPKLVPFRFDLAVGPEVDVKGAFTITYRLFVEADLRTASGRKGRVGIRLLLDKERLMDGKKSLLLSGTYDPLEFPPQSAIFFDSKDKDLTTTVRDLRKPHRLTVEPANDATVIRSLRIHLLINNVEI